MRAPAWQRQGDNQGNVFSFKRFRLQDARGTRVDIAWQPGHAWSVTCETKRDFNTWAGELLHPDPKSPDRGLSICKERMDRSCRSSPPSFLTHSAGRALGEVEGFSGANPPNLALSASHGKRSALFEVVK